MNLCWIVKENNTFETFNTVPLIGTFIKHWLDIDYIWGQELLVYIFFPSQIFVNYN